MVEEPTGWLKPPKTKADLERQIAELRAELAKTHRQALDNGMELCRQRSRALAAEAENARLRALPLKDEVERVLDVDALAQEIRRVDGNHDLGAGALAEALLPFLSRLRAGEQEGWRDDFLETIEHELIDGLEVEITIGVQEYTFNHRQLARRILSALYPASPSVSEGGSRNG